MAGPDDGQFELMVSDLDMPFLDGYELACRVKASNRRTKVVIMTGSGLPQAAARAGCREVDGWLFKPFGLQAMRDVLKTLDLPHTFAAGPAPRRLRRSA